MVHTNRFIISFEAKAPFVRDGMEWVELTVVGQAFLLHQIRKMVALAVEITRGRVPEAVMDQVFSHSRVNIPLAPSQGLFLDKPFFDFYNEKWGSERGALEWEMGEVGRAVEQFKHECIVDYIIVQVRPQCRV
jgi:tRNA pseudouridine38-40 synthase